MADKTQNLYQREQSWTDQAMKGAGFQGGWTEVKYSYRLPADMLPKIVDFTEQFIPAENRINLLLPEQVKLELSFQPTSMCWLQVPKNHDAEVQCCVDAIVHFYIQHKSRHTRAFADIVFMTGSRKIGMEVVRKLGGLGVKVLHTFGTFNNSISETDDDHETSRKQKCAFYLGREMVKATTIHSFKGLESNCLVLHIGNAQGTENLSAIYAALTRLKRSEDSSHDSKITIICSDPALAAYGQTWPSADGKHDTAA
ncbi:hypothetical protein GCM10023116_20410 [Kistimonas scapharcae]|uniref:Uncharacterized protein n=1 Tax=Kistimonas scapharcae TaxID=1036133 RepID=A0ABP8V3X1_9GAMM